MKAYVIKNVDPGSPNCGKYVCWKHTSEGSEREWSADIDKASRYNVKQNIAPSYINIPVEVTVREIKEEE